MDTADGHFNTTAIPNHGQRAGDSECECHSEETVSGAVIISRGQRGECPGEPEVRASTVRISDNEIKHKDSPSLVSLSKMRVSARSGLFCVL